MNFKGSEYFISRKCCWKCLLLLISKDDWNNWNVPTFKSLVHQLALCFMRTGPKLTPFNFLTCLPHCVRGARASEVIPDWIAHTTVVARAGLWGKRRDNLSMNQGCWTPSSRDGGLFGKRKFFFFFQMENYKDQYYDSTACSIMVKNSISSSK